MKIHTRPLNILAILLAAILVVSACNPQQKLIGTWSDTHGNPHEFTSGGIYIITFPSTTVTIKYRVLDDASLVLVLTNRQTVCDYAISGDKLTLTCDGDTEVLTRVK
jgi:hypothetical protein